MALQPQTDIARLPENILLEIFTYLPVKDRCVLCRVCRAWRRIANDNSLWRHVDLSLYKLNLAKMWKVIRAHFSDALLTLRLRGFLHPGSIRWEKHSLSDAMLSDLSTRCPNMLEFSVKEANLSNLAIKSLSSKLTKLNVSESLIPFKWFKDMEKDNLLPNLVYLDLSGTSGLLNADVKDFCVRTTLQVLKLNSCYRVSELGFETIAKSLSNLHTLEISQVRLSPGAVHHISKNLKNLTHLDIHGNDVKNSDVVTILECLKNLSWLNMSSCRFISDDITDSLLKAQSLKYLDITDTQISEYDIDVIEKIPSLTIKK